VGFQISNDVQTLSFDSPALAELEVNVRPDVSLQAFFDMQLWLGSGNAAEMKKACQLFGDEVLDSWNLEDKNGPVPANADGFLTLPIQLATKIIEGWSEEAASAGKVSSPALNGTSP
jgi:hypothetical protein